MTGRARNWTIVALIVLGLPAACAYSFYRLTLTEPTDSPIVQAFLIDDDGNRPRRVLGPDTEPEPVTDARLHAIHGLAVLEAKKLVEHAGLHCALLKKDNRTLHCAREFYTVAGPGRWELNLHLDDRERVTSVTATRWGHSPHY